MATKSTLPGARKSAKSQAMADLPDFRKVRKTTAAPISLRLRGDILALVDALARSESVTRTDAIEMMLEFAFAERAERLGAGFGRARPKK